MPETRCECHLISEDAKHVFSISIKTTELLICPLWGSWDTDPCRQRGTTTMWSSKNALMNDFIICVYFNINVTLSTVCESIC